jgi:hypothetical protein
MSHIPTHPSSQAPRRDPLAAVAVSAAPIVLEGRYASWSERSFASVAPGEDVGRSA